MNPEDRLQIMQALEEKRPRLERRAHGIAWLSVVAAAVVLGLMIWTANTRLRAIQSEVAATQAKLDALSGERKTAEQDLVKLRQEIGDLENQRKGLQQVLYTLPSDQRDVLVQRAIQQNPGTAALVPRVYLHIVSADPRDRAYAETVAEQLRKAGLLVVSIQTIASASSLKVSDVRYHNQRDAPEADRILRLVQAAGETTARLNPKLEYANEPAAANKFEVWLAKRGAS